MSVTGLKGGQVCLLTPVQGEQQSPSHPEKEQPREHAGGDRRTECFVSYHLYI